MEEVFEDGNGTKTSSAKTRQRWSTDSGVTVMPMANMEVMVSADTEVSVMVAMVIHIDITMLQA